MKITRKNFILSGVLSVLAVAGLTSVIDTVSAQQTAKDAANGSGSLIVRDEQGNDVRRQFSFEAHRNKDGTVSGHATIHNASFTGANGKTYQSQITLTCLKIVGNYAFLGGTVRRTNDPSLSDSAFFSVQDNGEPGKNTDLISLVAFDSMVGPQSCQNNNPGDFPMIPIDAGNIQVRTSASQ